MPYEYGTPGWEAAYLELTNALLDVEWPPYIMGTPAWVGSYEKLIQQDVPYREAAAGWEGSVVIHILARPELGIDADIYLYMDLWHGDCRYVRMVPARVGEAGDFVITGDYDRWRQVMAGELDTVKGLMQGKLKLKGDLPTIVRYVKAATRLVEIVQEVPTIMLDEMTPEETDTFREWVNAIRSEFDF